MKTNKENKIRAQSLLLSKKAGDDKPVDKITPEDILSGHTPKVRALCERLRKLVKQTVPNAAEAAYPVWHGIGYRHPEAGYFCAIFPFQENVKLGFEFGVILDDPDGLLEGAGKQVRYVNIKAARQIRAAPIKRFLLQSTSLRIKKVRKKS